ncbi:YceD family protein [Pollutimonas harenae]|uniref:Large ribosomal RNA subunit accumulation protein YceD n=1 Tax=Pollutimonas harenae TaxID=657015 RepID=A0A853GTP2_9BURK|nr:YceD family protein [Pollutimonas harenae]NYT85527.1 DUF177 domain-containing protein [Pollutimonas harenae]TEA70614.1 hypothetical protein ERD84_08000 [Pollutimonas harenae]
MQYIDAYELARLGDTVRGTAPIVQFARLLDGLPEQGDAQAEWAVTGEKDAHGQYFLRIAVRACPVLECQRCMQAFSFQMETENRVQLVRSEADLELEDDHQADTDEVIERIVGSARLDVSGLVEDEIILSLPYVPKHDVCPSLPTQLADEPVVDTDKPSPFAVLSQLKKN